VKENNYMIPAVEKAIGVLECLCGNPSPMGRHVMFCRTCVRREHECGGRLGHDRVEPTLFTPIVELGIRSSRPGSR